MSARNNLRELQQRAKEGPLVPDSTLYRAIQHAARSIASRLLAADAKPNQERGTDIHTAARSNRDPE